MRALFIKYLNTFYFQSLVLPAFNNAKVESEFPGLKFSLFRFLLPGYQCTIFLFTIVNCH